MSDSDSETSLINYWKNLSSNINRYASLFLLVFGVLGNILNILVLSQRSLKSNSCAWLFLLSSIFNFISLLSGLTTRIIGEWTYDITETVGWLCKLRIFVLITSRTIAWWLLTLATLDRWLLSCLDINRRQLSSLTSAKHGSLIVVIFCTVLYSPIFYCQQANVTNAPLKCYSRSIQCRLFIDQIYTIFTTLLPLILMFFFGFLTMRNVKKLRRRLSSSFLRRSNSSGNNQEQSNRLTPIDRRLLIMLLIQISFLALFTLPQAFSQIYSTITLYQSKSLLRRTVETSIYKFTILITYIASGMSFYVYTLSGGHVFRHAFISLLQRMTESLFCQKNNC